MTILGIVVATGGAALVLIAAIGLVRLPDLFSRLHAATKATVLGIAGILLATVLLMPAFDIGVKAVVAVVFQLATAPVAAHVIGRAGYRAGVPTDADPDELGDATRGPGRRPQGTDAS